MNLGAIQTETGPVTRRALEEIKKLAESVENSIARFIKNNTVITAHDSLQGLDFANSAHTGFASTESLNTTNLDVADNVADIATNAAGIVTNANSITALKSSAHLTASRGLLTLSGSSTSSLLNREGQQMTGTWGYQMPGAGSILKLTYGLDFPTFTSGAGDITFKVFVNGVEEIAETYSFSSSTFGLVTNTFTYASGAETFATDDSISMSIVTPTGMNATINNISVDIVVELD